MKQFTVLLYLLIYCSSVTGASQPNIVFILADDLGYGDVSLLQPRIEDPYPQHRPPGARGNALHRRPQPIDGMHPHTLQRADRTHGLPHRMRGVFTGAGGPCMIEKPRLTIGGMLQEKGYTTALFGKWHVGMTFFDKEGKAINKNGLEAVKRIDYSRAIPDAPIHRGFDHFFGSVCCPTTDWLYAFIDGDRIPVPPTKIIDRGPLPKHPYSRDNRPGMIAPGYEMEGDRPPVPGEEPPVPREPREKTPEETLLPLPLNPGRAPFHPSRPMPSRARPRPGRMEISSSSSTMSSGNCSRLSKNTASPTTPW